MPIVNNLTNPGQPPVTGDTIQTIGNTYSVTEQYQEPVPLTQGEIDDAARQWRDSELFATDWVVPLSDFPERDSYITYRQELRDWPNTSEFPNTKPERGV